MVTIFAHSKDSKWNSRKASYIIACVCIAIILAVAFLGKLYFVEATTTNFSQSGMAPSAQHVMGTDIMGRDMFARTFASLSTSVVIGLAAAVVSTIIATALGVAAGFGGSKADAIVSWLSDLCLGVPHLILLALISFALGKGFLGVIVGLSLTHWPSLCRLIRSEVVSYKNREFLAIAQKLGKSKLYIARHHILKFLLPQIAVGFTLMFPHAILHEAALSFLGLGLSPDYPSIGVILGEAMTYLSAGMWWLAIFPGVALLLLVAVFNIAANRFKKLSDPLSAHD